ncbi:hypothetical protein HCN44_001271 [Aphidius gifuensis]|uniref:hydroxyacylglutathione hydrolase n=1 Tax=Aphidius gifuensis TaxID=684658 RepID=A0A835CP12_APHGI|nr:hydroxyacylglutathione hydrolase, mitochondrial [Aphidius gifuensis]KAF7988698.1 hypothetical protein HCN44_001271 [Aphidius gifuensis]
MFLRTTKLVQQFTAALSTAKNMSSNMSTKLHSSRTKIQGQGMNVEILPALGDNFMYLIVDNKTKEAAIVDPVDPELVASAVNESGVNLTKVLTTHHHWDHAGGNKIISEMFKNIEIIGGDSRIEAGNHIVQQGDTFDIGNLKVECLATPCHTTGHICYNVTSDQDDAPAVFTGDTLFIGGCGRFFEGTAQQMYTALVEKLGSLPDKTKVYCGHEYTCKNLQFGLAVEPNNENIMNKFTWAMSEREKKLPTVPSTIGDEKMINPFMRVHEKSVQSHTHTSDPIETMASLRKEKDNF